MKNSPHDIGFLIKVLFLAFLHCAMGELSGVVVGTSVVGARVLKSQLTSSCGRHSWSSLSKWYPEINEKNKWEKK